MEQRRFRDLALPVAVAALLFLPLIGERVLFISDEARYALLARHMVEDGHWLVPRIGDAVHTEKPPAFAWAIAGLSLLGGRGVTELASVLPAALSGIGGVAMTVALGRRLFGGPAALVAGLVLATSFGYFTHARMALADMTLTFCAVGSLWAFWRAGERPDANGRWMALFYAFLALGLSAKGPYALMPLGVAGAFLVTDGGWHRLRALRPLTGVVVLGAVVAPWALAFAWHGAHSYVREVVVGDFGVHFQPWESAHEILFPLGPLGLEFLPWTLCLPAAFVAGFRRAPTPETRRRFRLLLCWTLVYVVPVTLSSHKRDRYLLAVYPALALAVGWLVSRWQARGDDGAARRHAWLCAGVAALVALAFFLPLRPPGPIALHLPESWGAALPAAALALAAAVILVLLVRRGRPLAGFVAFALGIALLFAYETRLYVARYNRVNDVKAFARLLVDRVPADATIVSFGYARLSIDFYTRRFPIRLRHAADVRALLARGAPVYIFAEPRGWRILTDAGLTSWTRVGEVSLSGRAVTLAAATPAIRRRPAPSPTPAPRP